MLWFFFFKAHILTKFMYVLSVKSDVITLCVPYGRLLENEALGNRKHTSNYFQFKNGHRQWILIHNNTDLVVRLGQ